MAEILQFPSRKSTGMGPSKARPNFSLEEISRLSGLSQGLIRRWTREGLITSTGSGTGEQYDLRALKRFRRAQELRRAGMSLARIGREMRGQLNLFVPPEESPTPICLEMQQGPFERALMLFDLRDAAAREAFQEAIKQGEFVPDCYCNLGVLEFEAGELTMAFDCFTNALKTNPRHFESHFNLANLYLDMGDHSLASEHYRIAAAIEPKFANSFFNLGLATALKGELQEAISAFRQFETLCDAPEDAAAARELLTKLQTTQATPSGAGRSSS